MKVESSKDSGNIIQQAPVELTIMSNDVSLFTDTNIGSHKQAISRFWARLRTAFNNNIIRSVSFFVFETGVAALPTMNNNMQNSSITANSHRLVVAQCVKMIQNHVTTLSDREIENNGGHLNRKGMPMDFKIEFLGFHPIMYQSLIRRWAASIVNPVSGGGRIHFDLPETVDGTQCSVDLDLSYITLPHRIDSAWTLGLVNDMKLLVESFVEIIQLVPLSSVDLSFMYGIPMQAKAGLQNDLLQYKEMKILVNQLWKYLESNDVALVLQSTSHAHEKSKQHASFGYHSSPQMFILIAEKVNKNISCSDAELNSTEAAQLPESGILYRYVSKADCILLQSPESSATFHATNDDASIDENLDERTQVYSDYLQRSLDFIDTAELNPFMLNVALSDNNEPLIALSKNIVTPQDSQINQTSDSVSANFENAWLEDVGVGCSTRLESSP